MRQSARWFECKKIPEKDNSQLLDASVSASFVPQPFLCLSKRQEDQYWLRRTSGLQSRSNSMFSKGKKHSHGCIFVKYGWRRTAFEKH